MSFSNEAVQDQPTLVVNPGEDGFQVYEPENPSRVFQVTGGADNPQCTCADFKWKGREGGYRCAHIDAVFRHLGYDGGRQSAAAHPAHDGRGGRTVPAPGQTTSHNGGGPASMTLKRSVSPDGRINSLSLEFTLPADVDGAPDLESQVLEILDRQDAIVAEYLDRHGGNGQADAGQPAGDGAVPATLKDVGGMQTRYGFRYFINVEAGNRSYKLFGTRQQLEKHLKSVGEHNARIAKGAPLNVPCRAVLEESDDGRYLNVVEILPQDGRGSGRR